MNTTIYMMGGTTEANEASKHLEQEGYRVVISVATGLGASLASGSVVDTGSKGAREIAEGITRTGAAAIVDCSHPFAEEASRQAARAAALVDVPYLRFSRPPVSIEASNVMVADGWLKAVEALSGAGSKALLTIGTRNLHRFTEAGIELAVRVLARVDSLKRCLALGVGPEDIIAANPPHSEDFNRACIRRTGAGVLVTKESGSEGGVTEKIAAAAAEGIDVMMIRRPVEPGAIHDLANLASDLQEALRI